MVLAALMVSAAMTPAVAQEATFSVAVSMK